MLKLKRRILIDLKDYKHQLSMSPLLKAKGVVTFKPERKGLKLSLACCVIEVDEQIIDYYRDQVNKRYGLNLIKPSWSAHVSVIQGSIDPNSDIYKAVAEKYEGREVELSYSIMPRYSGDTDKVLNQKDGLFWFLTVESDIFYDIRSELGLIVDFRPHLTIGKRN